MNKSEDLLLMTMQDTVYETVKAFLKSDLAIKGNVTGIDIKIEKGYVNAEWKFGNRKKGDIIQDE